MQYRKENDLTDDERQYLKIYVETSPIDDDSSSILGILFILFYFATMVMFVGYTQKLKKARLLKNQKIIDMIEASSTSKNRKKDIIANINHDLLKITNNVDEKFELRLHSNSAGVQQLTDIILQDSRNQYFEEEDVPNRNSQKIL